MKDTIKYTLLTACIVSLLVSILCNTALKSAETTANAVGTQSREITLPDVENVTEGHTDDILTTAEPEEIELVATAYCPCEKCCGKWAKNRDKVIGASGYELISGVSVAVDPDVFPYGTVFEINGRRYIAHDCGGAIKGNRIDFYFATHEQAEKFGKRIVKARVIE